MKYEMRSLQASDIFSVVKILNGIGLNNVKEAINIEEINNIRKRMTEDNSEDDSENNSEDNSEKVYSQVGVKVVMSVATVILENLPKVENDLYTCVGSVIGVKAKDVAKMDMGDFMDVLISIIQKEEFKDFFKRASKLIK